ncbi:MAG: hypothetical protein AB1467_03600 [Candidatus Diapherotrites archaeon]
MARKRFLPVYFLRMAEGLKQGTPRQQIVTEISEKYGIPRSTVSVYLSQVFPKKEAVTPARIKALLWEKRRAVLSSYDRSERALKREASLTPEQRRERALKGLKAIASLTPEQRRERALKAAASRLGKVFGESKYVEDLPVLNLLGEAERNKLYEEHVGIIDAAVRRFRNRPDFGDIQGTADLAFFVALTKWDRKADLPQLIKDQINYSLIVYFSAEKRHAITEVPFDERIAGKPKRGKR